MLDTAVFGRLMFNRVIEAFERMEMDNFNETALNRMAYQDVDRGLLARGVVAPDHLDFGTRARVIILASILCWTLVIGSTALFVG